MRRPPPAASAGTESESAGMPCRAERPRRLLHARSAGQGAGSHSWRSLHVVSLDIGTGSTDDSRGVAVARHTASRMLCVLLVHPRDRTSSDMSMSCTLRTPLRRQRTGSTACARARARSLPALRLPILLPAASLPSATITWLSQSPGTAAAVQGGMAHVHGACAVLVARIAVLEQ